jgi:hypothetical protein
MIPFFRIFLFSSFLALTPISAQDCAVLKDGVFTYKNGKENVLVLFNGNEHVEYHNDKKYFIKSTIQWISDCEYYLTLKEITLPNLPFKAGTKLHIKITKVNGDKVYYKSTLGSRSWEGRLTKKQKADE